MQFLICRHTLVPPLCLHAGIDNTGQDSFTPLIKTLLPSVFWNLTATGISSSNTQSSRCHLTILRLQTSLIGFNFSCLRPKEWENSASRFSVGAAGGKKKPAEGRAKENRVKCYTVKRGRWSQNGKVFFFISWMTFEELKLDCVQV